MEDIEGNIKALEEEKQEYLDEHPREETDDETEENVEVEEIEFSLTEDEINEWIVKLTELKVEKTPIELEVDEENILKINYEESEEMEDEDE